MLFAEKTRAVLSAHMTPDDLPFVLIFFGTAIIAAILIAVFFLAAQFWYIPIEERNAEKTFGQPYLDYKKNVRRWL